MRQYLNIIIILCLLSSSTRFVLDSYLPSLPAIGSYFGITDTYTQLTLTLYLFGFSVSQLVYGPLSDHFGRRKVIVIGLSIFFLGNLACALAASPTPLLISRFIAGVGAGSCGVLNRAIASDCFKGAMLSKAWSYTTTTLVLTLCLAPVLGGYVQELSGWRANFLLSTLLVGTTLAVILKYLPETHLTIEKGKENSHPPLKFATVFRNYKTILRMPSYTVNVLSYMLAFSGLIAFFQVNPLLIINTLGLTPAEYGWCSLFIALNYLAGGLIVTKFAGRVEIRTLLYIGASLLIVGGISMLLAYKFLPLTIVTVLLPAAIYVIGARIIIPNAIADAMEHTRHLNGSSSAMIGFIQMMGSALISLLISLFDNTSLQPLAIFLTTIGALTLLFILAPVWLPIKRTATAI